jgi:putative membrane protein
MSEKFSLPEQSKILQQVSAKSAFRIIVGVSLAALLFLVWLIYWKEGAVNSYPWVPYLPALNAAFNSLSTVFLLLGLNEIRKRNFSRHMKFMTSAFIASALFLTSYVIYHHFQGDTKFMTEGIIRYVYFFILITHIALSAFVVPLVLTSFYLALTGKFQKHRKVSKWTFPIWLYVSITGVVIFFMLKFVG